MSTTSSNRPSREIALGRVAARRVEPPAWHSFTPGQVQTLLQQRQPAAVRRHATRTTIRVVILGLGDLVAATLVSVLGRVAQEVGVGAHLDLAVRLAGWATDLRPTVFIPLLLGSLIVTDDYRRRSAAQMHVGVLRGSMLASLVLSWGFVARQGLLGGVAPFIFWTAILTIALAGGRAVSGRVAAAVLSRRRLAVPALLVAPWRVGAVPGEEEVAPPDRAYRVIGHVAPESTLRFGALGTLNELGHLIAQHRVEAVIVTHPLQDAELAEVLDVCLTSGCEFLYSARAVRVSDIQPSLVWHGDEPFFEFGTPVLKARELLLKRAIDAAVAGGVLAMVSPLLLAIAVAIKLDSRGPVLFAQNRAGLGGRRFRMLKFRTMRVGADAEKQTLAHLNHSGDSRLFKIPNDPRVTRVGRVLRRWSLDELPQLWNVFVGHMSLIGPRPFFESDLEDYAVHHFRRLGAKPGITGLWQVSGRSSVIDFEEVVRLDRQYIEQWSIWLDLSILLRTIPAVLQRRGAY